MSIGSAAAARKIRARQNRPAEVPDRRVCKRSEEKSEIDGRTTGANGKCGAKQVERAIIESVTERAKQRGDHLPGGARRSARRCQECGKENHQTPECRSCRDHEICDAGESHGATYPKFLRLSREPRLDFQGVAGYIGLHHSPSTNPRAVTSPAASRRLTIGLVQMSIGSNPDDNLQHAAGMIQQAAARGARVICLPELFRSRYFCQREDIAQFDLAETDPGPDHTDALEHSHVNAHVVIIAPVFERRAPGVYHNSAAIIDADGSIAGLYRKMHIPDDPAYYEKFYFTPGDLGFPRIRHRRWDRSAR